MLRYIASMSNLYWLTEAIVRPMIDLQAAIIFAGKGVTKENKLVYSIEVIGTCCNLGFATLHASTCH